MHTDIHVSTVCVTGRSRRVGLRLAGPPDYFTA